MVAELVARPVRVDDDEVKVRPDERRVVVATVPDDDVCFLLGRLQDRRVVDPREDEVALGEVRLVLLALLDRPVSGVRGPRSVANRWTTCLVRSPYGIGWRKTATRFPSSRSSCATRRVVWLLPDPVRTAQIATTGFVEVSAVSCGDRSRKPAPAASAFEATCITCSCVTSE